MDDIPEPVRRFVEDYIKSVGILELLLLLESHPRRAWKAAEVQQAMRIQPLSAVAQLEYLHGHGLLVRERGDHEAFRYKPARPGMDSVIADLRHAFETRRVKLTKLIYRPSSPESPG